MDKTTLIVGFALLVIGAGLAWYIKPPERIYHTEAQQRQIDSLTTALVNTQSTNESLRDSLESTSEKFREYIQEHEDDLVTLTTIRARLNTQIDALEDSLQSQQESFNLAFLEALNEQGEPAPIDTTFKYSRTFSNRLFEVTSYNRFTNQTFTDSLDVDMLRDLRFDFGVLQSDDRRTVESVFTSPDLDSVRISAQTNIKPPKRKLHWGVLISFGILIREGVDLLLNR